MKTGHISRDEKCLLHMSNCGTRPTNSQTTTLQTERLQDDEEWKTWQDGETLCMGSVYQVKIPAHFTNNRIIV